MSNANENTVSNFSTAQVFKSRGDLMNWVQDVGRKDGYVIITKRSKTTLSGVTYKVILMCDRGGIFKSKSEKHDTSDREINSKKINWSFELEGTYSQINDFLTLQVKCDKHNHNPTIYMEGHSYVKRLTDDEASLVADLTVKNVKPRDIYSTIKTKNENNWGFRSVATCLGYDENYWPQIRRDLLREIETHEYDYAKMFQPEHVVVLYHSINFFESGFALFYNWMIMSDTGAIIVSSYNVIVHFISERDDTTWLPLWSGPPENQNNVTWVIGHVHGNHYIKVDLQGDYLLPKIHPQWFRYKRDCATTWETLYVSRL